MKHTNSIGNELNEAHNICNEVVMQADANSSVILPAVSEMRITTQAVLRLLIGIKRTVTCVGTVPKSNATPKLTNICGKHKGRKVVGESLSPLHENTTNVNTRSVYVAPFLCTACMYY